MQIHGFNKTTLLDYPKHLAATIFLGGCNYRCPFCHNASLVMDPDAQPTLLEEDVLSVLFQRNHILEGVCITGGEPTIHKDLPNFVRKIKEIGLKVKLDTNGNNPKMLKYLVEENLLDFIAMDIKNSIEKYDTTIGILNFDIKYVTESISYIMNCGVDYEFRTTVVKELHTQSDLIKIGNWIEGSKAYYLQNYKDSGDTIFPGFSSYTKQELEDFKKILTPFVEHIQIRGVD